MELEMASAFSYATATATATTNSVWTLWNSGTGWAMAGDGSTTGALIGNDPWATWNITATGGSITTGATDDPWPTWNQIMRITGGEIGNAIRLGMELARNPELEAAHRRQREADRVVHQTRMRQERAKREAAEARAEKLLMSILSSSQQAQYQAERRFTVHLPNGHHYRVRKGRHGNLERIDETGKRLENLCVHVAPHMIPDCDNMAAQKLMLESNEQELRKIANITRIAA